MKKSIRIRTQTDIRHSNIRSVLSILEVMQPVSRRNLAGITGMSPTTVTRIVNVLLALGLVEEGESEDVKGRGRKAIGLKVRYGSICAVGVSLEPNRIRLCLVDFSGRILCSRESSIDGSKKHPLKYYAKAAWTLFHSINEDILPQKTQVRSIGIGIPGIVDCDVGSITRSDQMGWNNVMAAITFSEVFGLPSYIENDVKSCLTGEKVLKGIADHEDIAYLLIGTGVGVSATANGQLIRGKDNMAGEIDNVVLGSGKCDMLQEHLVETSILRRAHAVEPQAKTLSAITSALDQNIEWAQMLVGDIRRCITMILQMIDGINHPHRIILGGSIIPVLTRWMPDILKEGHIFLGSDYVDTCMTGAGFIALRAALHTLIIKELDRR